MPDLDRAKLERYLTELFPPPVELRSIRALGATGGGKELRGYGYGEPLLLVFEADGAERRLVLSTVKPGPYGHEHMSDRAQAQLWSHGSFNELPQHARALDVGGFTGSGRLVSLRDVEEVFLAVEYIEGRDYHEDLDELRGGRALSELDGARVDALVEYLAGIHATRRASPVLYARRVRELLGHGECIMGVVDGYPLPQGFIDAELLESIEHRVLEWTWRLKHHAHRLRQVHGDFHPWNIIFQEGTHFRVIDRSRGEWGDPADDVTCITMNYLFFSLLRQGRLNGGLGELFSRFWTRYLDLTGDEEMLEVVAPFFAFRGLVLASPIWYPDLDECVRRKLFSFVEAVLAAPRFDPDRTPAYLEG
jgi:hypothetical protein